VKLPVLKCDELIKIVENCGFNFIRQKGSHRRFIHPDGRATTIPIHPGKEIPKGLLRKIIREDLQIEIDEFISLIR
jgi:predicted RNA binding protein YcfA (HicA-like mRNA interferase family)